MNTSYQRQNFRDIFIASAYAGLDLQNENGTFPPGHNGSWNVLETHVRNTGHWIITCAKAYELTQDVAFKDAVERAGNFLLSPDACPFGHTYRIMQKKGWETNGIVGQAWVLEALLAAWKVLDNDDYLQAAHSLVIAHSFNRKLSLWHITSLEGQVTKEHTTLNQQIWFTACAHQVGLKTNDPDILEKSTASANNFSGIAKFNGNFIHMIVNEKIYSKYDWKTFFKWKWKFFKDRRIFDLLSKGYISYSLYPLAILHESDNSLQLWKTEDFHALYLSSFFYMEDHVFKYSIDDNPYAFSYHPTGFEAAYILDTFSHYLNNPKRNSKDWIEKQINQHFDFQKNLMCKNTYDPNTLAARLYEVTRISDMDIEIETR